MKRKMINYMARFLHECGIEMIANDALKSSKTTPYRKLWRLITMGTFFTMIIIWSLVYSVLNRDDFYNAISTMPFFAATFTSMSAVVTVFRFRKKLSQMLYEMDNNMFTYPDEILIDVEYDWYLREDNIVAFMNAILGLHYFIVTAITIPGFVELILYGKIKTFLYPCWTPWTVDDVNSQLFTLIFQYFTLYCGATVNMINVLTLYITYFEFFRQYKRLIAAIRSLKRRTLTAMESEDAEPGKFHRLMRENIVHCIRHYQLQYKNLQIFETWFSEYFSYELTVYVLSFAFGLFITMNAPSLEKVINQLAMILYTNFSILIKCIVGDVLVELNQSVAYALFSESDWHESDKGNQGLMRIFHLFVRTRRVNLMGFSIFPATRVTFAEVLRCAYSVFNVMNLSMNN